MARTKKTPGRCGPGEVFVGAGPTITFQRGTAGCTAIVNLGGVNDRLPTAHSHYAGLGAMQQHGCPHGCHAVRASL